MARLKVLGLERPHDAPPQIATSQAPRNDVGGVASDGGTMCGGSPEGHSLFGRGLGVSPRFG